MTFYQIYSYAYSHLFVNKNVSLGFIKKKNIYIYILSDFVFLFLVFPHPYMVLPVSCH